MNIENFVQRLVDVSPSACQYLDSEGYLVNFDVDDVRLTDFVRQLYSLMVGDFHEIGIEFTCSLGDLCSYDGDMELGVLLGELLLPAALYRNLATQQELRGVLKALVQGIEDDPVVIQLINWIQEIPSSLQDTYLPVAEFFSDKITSTPIFNQYLRNMLLQDNIVTQSDDIDVERITAYLKDIESVTGQMYATLRGLVQHHLQPEVYLRIYGQIKSWVQVLTAPGNVAGYSYARKMAKVPDLSEDETLVVQQYQDAMQTTVGFFSKYYLIRNIEPTFDDIVLLLVWAHVNAKNDVAFTNEIGNIKMSLALPPEKSIYCTRISDTLKEAHSDFAA